MPSDIPGIPGIPPFIMPPIIPAMPPAIPPRPPPEPNSPPPSPPAAAGERPVSLSSERPARSAIVFRLEIRLSVGSGAVPSMIAIITCATCCGSASRFFSSDTVTISAFSSSDTGLFAEPDTIANNACQASSEPFRINPSATALTSSRDNVAAGAAAAPPPAPLNRSPPAISPPKPPPPIPGGIPIPPGTMPSPPIPGGIPTPPGTMPSPGGPDRAPSPAGAPAPGPGTLKPPRIAPTAGLAWYAVAYSANMAPIESCGGRRRIEDCGGARPGGADAPPPDDGTTPGGALEF